ncbi:MAG: hypothetical protein ABIH83_01025 [Candidatus Micrarchaeota archaeon]
MGGMFIQQRTGGSVGNGRAIKEYTDVKGPLTQKVKGAIKAGNKYAALWSDFGKA